MCVNVCTEGASYVLKGATHREASFLLASQSFSFPSSTVKPSPPLRLSHDFATPAILPCFPSNRQWL